MKIGTHSGPFHADEALAVYLLKLLPQFKHAEVVRSRDNAVLDACDIVVDVGAKYEPPKYYDHHQREFATKFSPSHTITKLSSAGLIYKHYGRDVLRQIFASQPQTENIVEGIYDKLYENFIEAVDALDNGVNATSELPKYRLYGVSLQSVVSNLAPSWVDDPLPAKFDEQFVKASQFMGSAFEAEALTLGLSWLPARKSVEEAFNHTAEYDEKNRLLVLDSYVPWKDHFSDLETEHKKRILYVLYPTDDSYRIQATAKAQGSFESRLPLPDKWRGLRDEQLSSETGVDGCVFVHAAGFIGGCKTKAGALQLAKLALQQDQ